MQREHDIDARTVQRNACIWCYIQHITTYTEREGEKETRERETKEMHALSSCALHKTIQNTCREGMKEIERERSERCTRTSGLVHSFSKQLAGGFDSLV
jgi:hypothetical protein